MKSYGSALLSAGLGFSLIFLSALTTDQIWQNVYISGTQSLRVTLSGGAAATSITSGTTTITSGTDKSVCFDDGGVINCSAGPVYTKTTGRIQTGQILISPNTTPGANFDIEPSDFASDLAFGANLSSADNSTAILAASKAWVNTDLVVGNGTLLLFHSNAVAATAWDWSLDSSGNLVSKGTKNFQIVEGAAPSGVASSDILYADSTAHRFKVNNNNGGAQTLAYTSEITSGKVVFSSSSAGTNVSNSATNYIPFSGVAAPTATRAQVAAPVAIAGTFKNLMCTDGAAPGAAKSYTITLDGGTNSCLMDNTGQTDSICTGFSAGRCCYDHTHTDSVTTGASQALNITPSGTPTATTIFCSIEFDPS